MANEPQNCLSMNVANDDGGVKNPGNRDLRLEVLSLRRRLKGCEDAEAKYAMMLREGDHRIKNSLQLVVSLMRLQAIREASVTVRDALQAAAARVSSIASIHDALQGTGGLDSVDLGASLRKMCVSLQAMAGDEGRIGVGIEAETLEIPISLAQPLLLAVNELVVNALRHAFPDRDTGSVRVSMARAGSTIRICVSDDGVGLPDDQADSQGYGMTLVAMLIKQVGGELLTKKGAGARFTICAPLAGHVQGENAGAAPHNR